jgi:assimilatory nitrate reductase catalytic subunit
MNVTQGPDGLAVSGNAAFPVTRGAICVKGWTAPDTLDYPERLRTPLVRNADGRLEPASWDAALTNEKTYLLGKFARVALGTSNIDYNGRFGMSSGAAASTMALGLDRGLPFPLQDIPQATVILLALANGILHVLIRDNLIDPVFIRDRTDGFEEVRRIAATYWPQRVEEITGVPEADTSRQPASAIPGAVKIAASIRRDTVFVPFHWGGEQSANNLTNAALDPTSKMPEFKVCATRVIPIDDDVDDGD